MNKRKILPLVLAGSIIVEMPISDHYFDSIVTHPHIEFEITVPFVGTVSNFSTGGVVSVLYLTSCLVNTNGSKSGQISGPVKFPSIKDAMSAPFPAGYESAMLRAETGHYFYQSPRFGWEFCYAAR
jgi:hypothetical protein